MRYPLPKQTIIEAPEYKLGNDTDFALYQVIEAYREKTDIIQGLTCSHNFYRNLLNMDGQKLQTTFHVNKKSSATKYILKFKTMYLMKHLFNMGSADSFIDNRRKNGKYYRDKIKENEPIEIPVVEVTPGTFFSKSVKVWEGNHRVVAFYDSGFEVVPAMTVFRHHDAFDTYEDYPFVKRW